MAAKTQNERLIADCIRMAKDRCGAGWSLLSLEMRQALVARQALAVLASRDGVDGGSWQAAADFAQLGLDALG